MPASPLCPDHGRPAPANCLGCRRTICDHCHHFLIHLRPWCPRCAKQHVPGPGEETKRWIIWFAKVGLTLAAMVLAFVLVPGFAAKIAASCGVGLATGRFFFVRDAMSMEIEEHKNGRKVKTTRVEV